ncbi:GerAB/ArcD/ProY family transporter [Paenibacillus agaridevorans]|uniref:GerAB/ArcD/ProY family transporter n=1 Tax=Paenibacillus agaridevorans TaxID=171404 RepID=UPI001BE41788|nr:GerAB/ArcD/ProY family transporter [Paenibacillus agaridevorans]
MVKTWQVANLYILTHIGVIFFLYPDNMIQAMEVSHWIGILTGFLLHILVVWSYMKGLSLFDRRNVVDIFLDAGKWIAVLLLAPVFVYLLAVIVISIRSYGEMITIIFLSSTPLWATMLLTAILAAYLALQGIEAILRTGLLLLVLCMPPTLFVLVSSFQHVDWHYVIPLFEGGAFRWSFVYNRSFLMGLLAVGGSFLFLGFVQPEVAFNQRYIRYASFLLLPLYGIAVYVPLLTFGHSTASRLMFPFIFVTDIVEVNWLMFERTSLFFTMSMIAFVLLFISLMLWNAAYLVQRVIAVRTWPIVLAIAFVLLIICISIDDWEQLEKLIWWNTFLRLYVMFVIPGVTLAMGLLHKRKGGAAYG